ncbi:putative TPM domain [Monocercomonoides exilis]|uniref:putative TPM domain n=1 Tax=Monocercomonoides exilis TaxID=2049356 RepID=UPI00355A115B|nr:putative TPM domain [Monocercomonoides exilis]|eukprot:MONOS_5285.1-p1 / transcript=MONOS_5285.1 / gene=MONOS_5285 / organism=Monocercomonoides_exilis_PA203 / gene_product=unspecified product / transcript_product=unspecified product / location=Mono_scaffold00152:27188-28356(+) / protein_length=289 / sequence_SO=supercontig / SO=protein_coding / is_pseudo=false
MELLLIAFTIAFIYGESEKGETNSAFSDIFYWKSKAIWKASSVPNPRSNPNKCVSAMDLNEYMKLFNCTGKLPPLWICDPDGFVSPSVLKEVNEKISELESTNGAEVGVIVVESRDSSESSSDFTKNVFNSWGVGKANVNNGALFSLMINDREMYIQTGKGIKDLFSGSRIDEILSALKPSLRDGNYDAAVKTAVDKICKVIKDNKKPFPEWALVVVIVVPILAVVLVPVIITVICSATGHCKSTGDGSSGSTYINSTTDNSYSSTSFDSSSSFGGGCCDGGGGGGGSW